MGTTLTSCFDNMFPTSHSTRQKCPTGTATCKTDSLTVSVNTQQLGGTGGVDRTAAENALAYYVHPTDLNVTHQNPAVFSDGSFGETDLVFWYTNSSGIAPTGITCENSDNPDGQRCDQSYIYYNKGWTCANYPNADGCEYEYTLRSVFCHEVGHGVGLLHGREAMPYVDDQNSALGCLVDGVAWGYLPQGFAARGREQINRTYN